MKIPRSLVTKINQALEQYGLSLVELPPDGVGDSALSIQARSKDGRTQQVYVRISDE